MRIFKVLIKVRLDLGRKLLSEQDNVRFSNDEQKAVMIQLLHITCVFSILYI